MGSNLGQYQEAKAQSAKSCANGRSLLHLLWQGAFSPWTLPQAPTYRHYAQLWLHSAATIWSPIITLVERYIQAIHGIPPEPPEANAGKGAEEAGGPERSQGFARGFMRALLGTAAGLGGSSMMSVRMLGGVSPFSSISSTCRDTCTVSLLMSDDVGADVGGRLPLLQHLQHLQGHLILMHSQLTDER